MYQCDITLTQAGDQALLNHTPWVFCHQILIYQEIGYQECSDGMPTAMHTKLLEAGMRHVLTADLLF